MRTLVRFGVAAVAGLTGFAATRPALAAPLLAYRFNETGTSSASTGSDSAVIDFLTYNGSTNVAADPHTVSGGGMAGDLQGSPLFGIDRAFNGQFPSASAATIAGVNTTSDSLVGLTSWTVSGWFKAPSTISGGGRTIFNTTGAGKTFDTNGFDLRVGSTAGGLRVTHGATVNETAPTLPFVETGKWIFFAAAYDSATKQAKIYRGYRNSGEAGANAAAVTLVDTLDIPNTVTASPGTDPGFFVGGWIRPASFNSDVAQSFPGLLDNIRVDGMTSGSGGALSVSALEAYRSADAATPEPASLGTISIAAVMSLSRRTRRRGRDR